MIIGIKAGMILIKKEMDWTSFDLVNKCKISLKYGIGLKNKVGSRRYPGPESIRPDVAFLAGKYTKLTDQIHLYNKTYEGSFYLGATNPVTIPNDRLIIIFPLNISMNY